MWKLNCFPKTLLSIYNLEEPVRSLGFRQSLLGEVSLWSWWKRFNQEYCFKLDLNVHHTHGRYFDRISWLLGSTQDLIRKEVYNNSTVLFTPWNKSITLLHLTPKKNLPTLLLFLPILLPPHVQHHWSSFKGKINSNTTAQEVSS